MVVAPNFLCRATTHFSKGGSLGFSTRRGWGWGWPVAFGLGLGAAYGYPYYASYYSDPCIVWDGYAWVNVCDPYAYY